MLTFEFGYANVNAVNKRMTAERGEKMNELRGMIYSHFRTEAECARQLGWTRQKLNYITNGKRMPDIRDVNVLAKALDVEVGKLINIFLN